MIRKAIILLIAICLGFSSAGFSAPPWNDLNYFSSPAKGSTAKLTERFELFAGIGYFQPSLTKWNQKFEDFNANLMASGASFMHNFLIVRNGEFVDLDSGYRDLGAYQAKSNQNYLASDILTHLGFRYYFTRNLNLSFSVGRFKSEASSQFTSSGSGKEDFWPNYAYEVQDQITVLQKLEIYPTVLSLNFNLPIGPWADKFELYGGAGVGFNFSKVKAEIIDEYNLNQTRGDALWDSLSFSQNPISLNIISNIQANANPFCAQVSLGTNLKFGIVLVNFEVGYNFSKATFKDDDWRFFTRKFTPIVKIEGRQAPEYDVKYTEDRKYYFDIPESAFESFKVNEIDYSGLIFKGSIGLTF